jgi:thiamine biosynthesis lipoprotein
VLIQAYRRIMAIHVGVHVEVPPELESRAQAAINECFAWLAEVETCLTRFAPTSELSRLNAAPGTWHTVSDMLFAVLEESLRAAEATEGLFDPGLLPLLEAYGYDRDFALIAQREASAEWRVPRDLVPPGGWREIELDSTQRRVRLPPGVRLDFGGIAKGWAADVALERCFADIPNVMIDLGGDLRVRGGSQTSFPWAIGIGDAREGVGASSEPAVTLTLGAGGLATSGATQRWWTRAGERRHHLIDPRVGAPARVWVQPGDDAPGTLPLIATATALAPTAAHAEVAAKVALLRGYPKALTLVEAAWSAPEQASFPPYQDAPVALIVMLGDGQVACSTNLRAYLTEFGEGGDLWLE